MAEGARAYGPALRSWSLQSSRAVKACFCSHIDVCETRGSQANDKPLPLAMGDAVNECAMKLIESHGTLNVWKKGAPRNCTYSDGSPSEHDKEKLRAFPWVLHVLPLEDYGPCRACSLAESAARQDPGLPKWICHLFLRLFLSRTRAHALSFATVSGGKQHQDNEIEK